MNSAEEIWDVIIIGGGAAGLMAAASAGTRGKRVLLLEKNRKLGVKILMSGGTRCNITHNCSPREIIHGFGKNGKFLHSALAALSPRDVIEMIEAQGVETKVESTGKIFPVSDRAIDVRDALWRMAEQAGATLLSGVAVETISRQQADAESRDTHSEGFRVTTGDQSYLSHSIIITTGGKSYPGCGTTGDGYVWAEQFGHSIVTPYPALTPILTPSPPLELKGITLDRVHVKVFDFGDPAEWVESQSKGIAAQTQEAKTAAPRPIAKTRPKPILLAERESSFLFTHWGFSGPSILDVSGAVARHPNRKQLSLACDFCPEKSVEQLTHEFKERKLKDPKQLAINLLPDHLPRRFQEWLMQQAEVDLTIRNADLSKNQIGRMITQLKQTEFPINGTLGFEKAEVTTGGVALNEVDSKTMRSKLEPGLYFAGEVLDLDGRIGGYNFQSAFSTGWLAGKMV